MAPKKQPKVVPSLLLVFLVLLWPLLLPNPATGDESFQGKTFRILVGYPPGGGHDLEARVMARHLGKYIPGNPSVIVQNMPGAGGMRMLGYLYGVARPDGLSSGIAASSHFQQTLLRDDVHFDLGKMPTIWAVGGVNVDMVRDFLKAEKPKDLLKVTPSQIVIGAREKLGSSCIKSQLALDLLEIKGYKSVCAYPGTAVIKAAFERGEVSFFNGTDAHTVGAGAFADMVSRKVAVPLWQSGILTEDGKIARSPTVSYLPTFHEVLVEVQGKPPSGPMWDTWKSTSLNLNKLLRTLVLSPGTPPEAVAMLRTAIKKMYRDPAFVSDWEKIFGQKLEPVLATPEQGEELKNDFLKPAPWQEFLRKFVS